MFLHIKKSFAIRIIATIFVFIVFISSFTSCASKVLKNVDAQESAVLKLIIARDMISQTRYSLALRILRDMKEEYASNAQIVVEVDYEIAFIFLSRKRYKNAKERLEAIVAQYDEVESKNTLPQWPYYLSKKLLEATVYPVLEKRNRKKTQKARNKEQSS